MPELLERTCESVVNFITRKISCPIVTDKKFNSLLLDDYGLTPLEKKLVERHL